VFNDVGVVLQEMQGLTSIEDAESFMLKHGENIVDILGGEVDRIEKNLKVWRMCLSGLLMAN